MQRLSPPFFVKNLSYFKNLHFSTFHFCFYVFKLFGMCFKNTCFMHPLGPRACHCGPTLRSPGPGRVNPFDVFHVFGPRKLFSLFGWILTDLGHILGTFFQIVRLLVVQCIGKTTTRRHNERRNDKTTTKRHNETTKWNERVKIGTKRGDKH